MKKHPKIGAKRRNPDLEYLSDRQTLRSVKWLLDGISSIKQVTYEPNKHEPRLIRAQLTDGVRSPLSFEIEIRWFTNGDYGIYCVETSGDEDWWCLWENKDDVPGISANFFTPPNGEPIQFISEFPDEPIDIVLTAVVALEDYLSECNSGDTLPQ